MSRTCWVASWFTNANLSMNSYLTPKTKLKASIQKLLHAASLKDTDAVLDRI